MSGWGRAARIAVSPGVVSNLVTLLDNERDRENTQWEGGAIFHASIISLSDFMFSVAARIT